MSKTRGSASIRDEKRKYKENEDLPLRFNKTWKRGCCMECFFCLHVYKEDCPSKTQEVNMEHGRYTLGGRRSLQVVLTEMPDGMHTWVLRKLAAATLSNLWLIIEIRRSKCHSCCWEVQGGKSKELQASWPHLNPQGSDGASNNGNHFQEHEQQDLWGYSAWFPQRGSQAWLDNLLWQNDLPGRWGEDIKKSAGHGPGQFVQGGPTWTEVQTRSFSEVPLNLTILWFCKIHARLDISELKISRSSQWSEHICVYLTLETSKS